MKEKNRFCANLGLLKISGFLNHKDNKIYFAFHSCLQDDDYFNSKYIFSFEEIKELIKKENSEFEKIINSYCKLISDKNGFGTCDCHRNQKKFDGIVVNLNFSCNINCKYCFTRELRNETAIWSKDLENLYFDFLKKVSECDFETITVTGQGEPFFYKKRFYEFLKNIPENSKLKKINIITNGTLLDEEFFEIIKNLKIYFNFSVSLNAFDKESYKEITNSECFDIVLKNLELLKNKSLELSNLKLLNTSFVISEEIINNKLKFVEFISQLNYPIKILFNNYLTFTQEEIDNFKMLETAHNYNLQ